MRDAYMTLETGTKLGRYEVRSQIGAGGMGEVYGALDTELNRTIALKVLPSEIASDTKRMQRFKQEARSASALNHPNVAHIYEIGEQDGVNFIAMEFVAGITLRQHLSTERMKLNEVLDAASQAASALSAAHAAGIVHRDIKPDNIMLGRDGYVKVLDFGLAKLIPRPDDSEAPTLVVTDAGVVMGTVHYMSPEQARGLDVDARTDIWSLSAVIYEMIGGRPPFEGATSSDVITSILDRQPNPLARYAPEVPAELEWIVNKGLRKDRQERYQTAKELLADLQELKHRLEFEAELERSAPPGFREAATTAGARPGLETTAGPAGRLVSPAPSFWSRREARIAAAFGTVVILAVLGYKLLQYNRGPKETASLRNATFTQLTFEPGTEFFPSLSPDGKSFAYASRASGKWNIYVQRVGGRNPVNLTKDSQMDNTQPAFSPSGDRIAFRSEREGGGIYVMGGHRRICDSSFGLWI